MTFDSEKACAFWFHYNKPESKKRGANVLTVHCQKQCLMIHELDVKVPTKLRHRKTQPHAVLAGRGRVKIDRNKKATITAS